MLAHSPPDAMAMLARDRWERLQPLLDRALQLSGEQRATWLESLRSTDPDVAGELESLLSEEAAADARGFLSDPVHPACKRWSTGYFQGDADDHLRETRGGDRN